jgi:hypothetical protein
VAGLLITDVGLRSTSLGYDTIVALVVAGTMLYEIRAARRTLGRLRRDGTDRSPAQPADCAPAGARLRSLTQREWW